MSSPTPSTWGSVPPKHRNSISKAYVYHLRIRRPRRAQVGLRDHRDGVTDPAQRVQLRAELDGLVAHLYGLTESEFAHILTTFPLVAEPVKTAALQAYRDVAAGKVK